MFGAGQNSSSYDRTLCNSNAGTDSSPAPSINVRLSTPSFEIPNSATNFHPCTVDPIQILRTSNTDESTILDLSTTASLEELAISCLKKRALPELGNSKRGRSKHKPNVPKQAGRDRAARTKLNSKPSYPNRKDVRLSCNLADRGVRELCHCVGSFAALQQLKSVLRTIRQGLVASNEVLEISIGSLWRRLAVLKANDSSNEIIRRLCLYHLKSRKEALTVEMGSQEKLSGGTLADRVLTRMVDEANYSNGAGTLDIDRPKLHNELKASRIWYRLCQKYSIGILALIPGKHYGLSNSR